MTQTDLFEELGAPLVNSRWSWGGVREADGAVFLRVWEDRVREHEGRRYYKITHNSRYADRPGNPGHQERLRHVGMVRRGAPCYLVMCEAVDADSTPRKIKRFFNDRVFPGSGSVEIDGDWWIELREAVAVRDAKIPGSLPEEVPVGSVYLEGGVLQVLVNRYERDPAARRACVELHGTSCAVCGFDFAAVYGPLAAGIVHVHHLRPLSEIGESYRVDPAKDLLPVCPNCHAVIHQGGGCRGVDEVREMSARQAY